MSGWGYDELAELAETVLAADDFDPWAFVEERGIDGVDLTKIGLQVASSALAPDTLAGRAAVFVQGFQLGVLVGERNEP